MAAKMAEAVKKREAADEETAKNNKKRIKEYFKKKNGKYNDFLTEAAVIDDKFEDGDETKNTHERQVF